MYEPQFLVYLYDTPILYKSNRRGKNSRFRQKIPHFLSDIPGPLSLRERDGGCRFYSGRQSPRSYRTPTVRGVSCETSLFRLVFARNEKSPRRLSPFCGEKQRGRHGFVTDGAAFLARSGWCARQTAPPPKGPRCRRPRRSPRATAPSPSPTAKTPAAAGRTRR